MRDEDPDPAEHEHVRHAPKGSQLLHAVEVMDALRAPEGDAWSAAQTHHSLARYLLEETHEVLEAIEADDEADPSMARDGTNTSAAGAAAPAAGGRENTPTPLADELGDLLFQILFHARIAETEDPAWDVDEVARAFVAKMHRRNPHVFDPTVASQLEDPQDVDQIIAQWHAVKAQEKTAGTRGAPGDGGAPGRDGGGADGRPTWFAGIPHALPALQRAAKVVHRARADGRLEELEAMANDAVRAEGADAWGGDVARSLLEVVIRAERADVDPETALRTLVTRMGRDLPAGREDPLA